MKLNKKHIDSYLDNPKRILIGGAVIGIGGYLVYKLGKNILNNFRTNTATSQAGSSVEVQQALAIRSAINPSGTSWMMSFDTTNVQAVLDTAKTIKNLDAVSKAYQQLYHSNMILDLQSELSPVDYKKFLNSIPGGNSNSATQFASKYEMIVAKQAVILRTTPDASYHGSWYEVGENENILMTAKQGAFIGYATGNQSFDSKNNVKFIQVAYRIPTKVPASLQKYAGKQFSFWVSSSTNFVKKYTDKSQLLSDYPNLKSSVTYQLPITTLSGFNGSAEKVVITQAACSIYNENMQQDLLVNKGTLLGKYIMTFNTGDKKYIKFKTLDNTERWVEKRSVIIR